MKKNNRGFTLIELLAAVVVLGLLLIVTIPLVTKNISFGRSKTYVQDANKLIALAEYKLNSNSLKIEKPDPNNCIVLSFDYINDGSIDSPPNGGTYNGDVSFVIVKNNNGKLEYAVSLVEEFKNDGGYSGVKLSTESQLNSSRVEAFTKNKLIYLSQDLCIKYEVSQNRTVYNVDLVNSSIGMDNYVDTVEKVYLKDGLEQGEPSNAAAPKIKKSYVEFDHNVSEVADVGFVVFVNAIDNDSNNLTICIKDSEDKNDTYPEKNSNNCEKNYKSGSDYFRNFKYTISKDDEEKGVTKYFFVSVYDEDNNVSNTKFEKTISKNKAPEIKISVSKRDTDKVNTHIARIKIESIKDDRARKENLQYCINQSSTCDSKDYKYYDELFNSNGEYDYTISNNGKKLTKPKGGSYRIYAHVRDSYGEIGDSEPVLFEVSELTAPTVHYEVYPNSKFDKNDITGVLKLQVTDNYSTDDNIIVSISDATNRGPISYKDYIANSANWNYSLDSRYSMDSYTINLKVTNEYGAKFEERIPITNVYRNRAPVIESFDVYGLGYTACSENNLSAAFSINDDLDDRYSYCLTTDRNGCSNYSDFTTINYNNVSIDYHIPKNNNECVNNYVNGGREIILKVRDSYGLTAEKKTNYDTAPNMPPTIDGSFSITSTNEDGKNKENVRIDVSSIDIHDDKSNYKISFCYNIDDSTNPVCFKNNNGSKYFSQSQFDEKFNNPVDLLDENGKKIKNDGQVLKTYITVKDSDGLVVTSNSVNYVLYDDNVPEVIDLYKYLGVSDVKDDTNNTQGVNGVYGDQGEETIDIITDYDLLDIVFKVFDPGDTYSYCINHESSNDNFGCDTFDGENIIASGDDRTENSSNENNDEIIASGDENNDPDDSNDGIITSGDKDVYETYRYYIKESAKESLYLHIVDSDGNKVTKLIYGICSEPVYLDGDDYSGPENEKKYIKYEPVNSSRVISNDYCNKQCYIQENKAIPYFKKYNFKDILGKTCNNESSPDRVMLSCDYYSCVGDDRERQYIVYGKVKMYSSNELSFTTNGTTNKCHEFYYKYTAMIVGEYVSVKRNKNDNKACANMIDNHDYTRIDDSSYIFEHNCGESEPYCTTTNSCTCVRGNTIEE